MTCSFFDGIGSRVSAALCILTFLQLAGCEATPSDETASALPSGWMTSDEGCQVWNQAPAPGETVSWSGPCVDGKAEGEGVLVWRTRNDGKVEEATYMGSMKGGNGNGHGAYTWANGNRYEGDWVDNQRSGHGVFTWPNGERYEGEFLADKRSGRGVFTWPSGSRYEGGYLEGERHGSGVCYFVESGMKKRCCWSKGREISC